MRNAQNLYSMWMGEFVGDWNVDGARQLRRLPIFSNCADSVEQNYRLESLSWRLWNRDILHQMLLRLLRHSFPVGFL
jgi:Fungal protein of unknown function (DUF1752)